MTPIPILYTIPNFLTAGSGFALFQVVTRLDRTRFQPNVAVMKSGGQLEQALKKQGIPVIEAAFTQSSRPYWSMPLRIRRHATASPLTGFPIWHSFHYLDDYSEPFIARRCGAKFWVYTKKNMSWNGRSWWLRSRFANRIAAQNTSMLRRFFTGRSLEKKAVFIPPSVDTEIFAKRPGPERPAILDNIPATACLAVNVAHMIPLKGQDTMIRAIAEVPDLHFAIAGRADDHEHAEHLKYLAELCGVTDRVHFLGPVSDVSGLLAAADIFLFGSIREACPVAVLEAMSCGLPCVVPDIPGCHDMIQTDVHGIHVKPGNHLAMASAIQRLQADPELRERLGDAARSQVVARFSVAKEVAAYEMLYTEMIANSPHHALLDA